MRYYLVRDDLGLVVKLSRNRYMIIIDSAYVDILEESPHKGYKLYYCDREDVEALLWFLEDEDNRSFKSVSREVLLTSSIPEVRSIAKKSKEYLQTLYDLNTSRVNPRKHFFYEDLMDL